MKNTPDEKKIEQLLENIPPEPGNGIRTRLASAPWTPRAVAHRRTYLVASLVVLGLAIMTAATPQGRVWAQGLLSYFTRADSDTIPVDTSAVSDSYLWDSTTADVESQAGFTLLAPAWLPKDQIGNDMLSLKGAEFDPENGIVRLFYAYVLGGQGNTDGLVLREQRFTMNDDCSLCGTVGANALVETVQINGNAGEYVQGVWKSDDSGVWNWVADPYVKTLRWQVGHIALEIQYFGMEISQADLIAIAESIK